MVRTSRGWRIFAAAAHAMRSSKVASNSSRRVASPRQSTVFTRSSATWPPTRLKVLAMALLRHYNLFSAVDRLVNARYCLTCQCALESYTNEEAGHTGTLGLLCDLHRLGIDVPRHPRGGGDDPAAVDRRSPTLRRGPCALCDRGDAWFADPRHGSGMAQQPRPGRAVFSHRPRHAALGRANGPVRHCGTLLRDRTGVDRDPHAGGCGRRGDVTDDWRTASGIGW